MNNVLAPVYNLKAVVMETGLKPPTIRAWERRYGIPDPERTAGGHRHYSQRDIDTLKWLVARQAEGMSISHAVELWRALENEGSDPLRDYGQVTIQIADPAVRPQIGSEMAELRQGWVAACLSFDRAAAEQVLARAFALFPPEVVAIELLQAGLAEIGELWYRDEISVQQEHFTSAMSVQRLEMLIAAAPQPMRPGRIIVASAQDDYHVFSPLLITLLLRRRGWDVLYLGADVPPTDLEETITNTNAQMMIISAQLLSTAAFVLETARSFANQDLIIGYGGQIFNVLPQLQERVPAHFLGQTIEAAVANVEQLMRRRPSPPAIPPAGDRFQQALVQFDQQRPLIESSIWADYAAAGKPTEQLAELNLQLAGLISAALKFGDGIILDGQVDWVHYLAASYRLSELEAKEYIAAYHRATQTYLKSPAQLIAGWLGELGEG